MRLWVTWRRSQHAQLGHAYALFIAVEIQWPGPAADIHAGLAHRWVRIQRNCRNKRSLTVDLRNGKGRALVLERVRTADIVVENFRPEVKERRGLGYDALSAVNPRVILISISGFGQDGPYRERPGFDQILQGMCGLMRHPVSTPCA